MTALRPARNAWAPETIGRLREMAATDLSATEIGRRLGVSKNAVIGKLGRLGLLLFNNSASPRSRRSLQTPEEAMQSRSRIGAASRHNQRGATSKPIPASKVALPPLPETPPETIPERFACHWVNGDPMTPGWRYCGQRVKGKGWYCAGHHAAMYQDAPRARL